MAYSNIPFAISQGQALTTDSEEARQRESELDRLLGRIEELRLRQGFETRRALAEASEIREGTIAGWYHKKSWPHSYLLPRLAAALDCSLEYLLTGQSSSDEGDGPIADPIAPGLLYAIGILREDLARRREVYEPDMPDQETIDRDLAIVEQLLEISRGLEREKKAGNGDH